MIIAESNNEIDALYARFEPYIIKHFNYIVTEESIRNYSYLQLPLLKLICAFELIKRLVEMYNIVDENYDKLYTLDELLIKYDIYSVSSELAKHNIDINHIIATFTSDFTITTSLEPFMNGNTIKYRLNKIQDFVSLTTEDIIDDEPIDVYRGTTRFLSFFAGYDNEPRPYIQNEWSLLRLYIRKNNVNILEFYWDNASGTDGDGVAIPTSTAGEITFELTPALIASLTTDGLYDIRLYFEDLDGLSDIFENTNAINIKS